MGLMSAPSSWRLRPGASAWPEVNGFLFFADGLAGLLIGACLLMTALGLSLQAIQWHQQARQRQLAAMLQQDSDQAIPAPEAGAGLGMTVVRHIVALHQGSLMVEWGQSSPVVLVSLPTGPIDPHASVRTPAAHQAAGNSTDAPRSHSRIPRRMWGQLLLLSRIPARFMRKTPSP